MSNIHGAKSSAKDPDALIIGTSSVMVIPENYSRDGATLINISGNFISISFGGTAAILYKGITLTPNGGSWAMDDYAFTNEQINAIASAVNSTLCIQEYIR